MAANSNKVGHINKLDERIDWPEVNVIGRRYERPAATHSIGENLFVVLPRMITPEVLSAIEEVKASISVPLTESFPEIEAIVVADDTKKKGTK